jgi:hypothetical protein
MDVLVALITVLELIVVNALLTVTPSVATLMFKIVYDALALALILPSVKIFVELIVNNEVLNAVTKVALTVKLLEVNLVLEVDIILIAATFATKLEKLEFEVIENKLELSFSFKNVVLEVIVIVFEAVTLPPLIVSPANKVLEPNIPYTVALPVVNPPTFVLEVVTALAVRTEAI